MEYIPKGVCSRKITFDIKDDIIQSVEFLGGCNGNGKGLSQLLKGMNVHDAISRLGGIQCDHKVTSCPDQLSIALKATIA